ncbi:NADPH-dependent ferric siderophore reductase [Amylibacter kogurei]|uniref:NADPH-dependent ferric siderophore reductase n=1 Tax=Paramylibacter kogurei TaxID=1889778 RepID=A0A2G5K3R4_9RHOB|nr:siderophore-interacting protein [Amylibacter kogurei]PIB24055.1 NADPH-dependent ferric siderophore reductase [Amylibacter kogurei]
MTKPQRPGPRLLTVKSVYHLTPNMIRVTFQGPELAGIAENCAGANCKIFMPADGQSREDFAHELENGRPTVRTYTVRAYRADQLEMDIDFVDHGDEGPASAWACNAKAGDFLGFRGPSALKLNEFYADWYLVAADMSALPVAGAVLETMPRDAKGVAIFEITSPEDKQDINAPKGVDIHWLVHENPHHASSAQEDFIRAMDWPTGTCQTCIAGESGVIKSLRGFLANEIKLPREDVYISGYWKIGLIEDEHQKMKRAEAAA